MGARSAVVASGARSAAASSAGLVWLLVPFNLNNIGVISPWTNVDFPAPVTGELAEVILVSTAQPNGNVTATPSIGGVAVTGGAATITTSDAAHTPKRAVTTGNKAVVAHQTSVSITLTNASTTAQRVTVMLGFKER